MRSGGAAQYNFSGQSAPQQAQHVLFIALMSLPHVLRSLAAALSICLAILLYSFGTSAHAQQEASETAISFDIPEQPLHAALAQYFSITGVQLLYDSTLASGLRSTRVKGRFTPREALRRLLTGSGLVVRYSGTDAAIITTPSGNNQSSLVPLGRIVVREQVAPVRLLSAERLAYYGLLEEELYAYLHASAGTERLNFSLIVHLRIDADGTLSDVVVHRSSGSTKTDLLVIEALLRAAVSPPPDGLQQPLAVALRGMRNGQRRP
ncbi:TonB C-terminal domain-containing protein [Sphingobium sp. H39-3-25]|nr:TonB C-terminal domain-containing protein [Sphingobium arseniciresistens]